jgi:aarF domain-containing kinase
MITQVESITSQIQTKKIPTTSLLRMWSLGSTHAKIAANFLSYAVQRNLLAGDKRQQAFNQAQLKSALQLLGTMGYLRGVVMKVGQLFANLPYIIGPELIEIFESMQFQAPPMHFSLIRELFLDELGQEPEDIFATFDRHAFAAASLGQVHRARLHDGTEVAVKIQYPDIARTIEADFNALGILLQTMRFKGDFQYLRAHVLDAKEVILQEVDYLQEAAYMEKNRLEFLTSDVVVPRSYPKYSSAKVLTMDYLPGKHLQDFLAEKPSLQQRNHFGELISYALIHSFFSFHCIYADLHPGNFIFMDDGRLGFLDFGCFRQFSDKRWHFQLESEEAMFCNDQEKILQFIAKISFHDNPDEIDKNLAKLMLRQVDWVVRPITTSGSFDFANKPYVDEGVALFKEIIHHGYSRTDSFYNWSNRALLGHRSLMYRLGCNFDYGSMYLREAKLVSADNNV